MSAEIQSTNFSQISAPSSPTTSTNPTPEIPLKDQLSSFVHGAPDEEKYLSEDQRENAKNLKNQILSLFTPEKLFELSEIERKDQKNVENTKDSFPSFTSSNFMQGLEHLHVAYHVELLFQNWEMGLLKFLQNINEIGNPLWEPAPDLPTNGIAGLQARISLSFLQDGCSITNLLLEAADSINREFFTQYVSKREADLAKRKPNSLQLPAEFIYLKKLNTNIVIEMVKKKEIPASIGISFFKFDLESDIISILETDLSRLKAFAGFLETKSTDAPEEALRGAHLYLSHQVDEQESARKRQGATTDPMNEFCRALNSIFI